MNRLWVRLTLAFVAVTLLGVVTVALLTNWSAGGEFRQYLARQDALAQGGLLDDLQAFYEQNASWNGVAQVFANYSPGMGRGQMRGRPSLLLADASGQIVYDERGTRGGPLTADERATAVPVASNGRTVGYLAMNGAVTRGIMSPAEQDFLDQLRNTLVIAALLAGALGILLGLVLSRALTAPLANLAQAARAFAARDWDRRVPVHGASEVAEVAREFNEMAATVQRAETLRRNLMADVAHELRTPLTVLQGNLRALLDGVYPLELSEIATLYDESRLLSRLVDDLRELALADAGHLPLNLQPVQLAAALAPVVASFTTAAGAADVRLTVEGEQEARVTADPGRFAQVVRNLIANALRHTPSGGSISITALSGTDKTVRIDIADTGEGIAAQDLPHVFDRFYRGDRARGRASGGTGLGLAIAKVWVEAMGGTIGVESEPGQGACFWFTLPRSPVMPVEP